MQFRHRKYLRGIFKNLLHYSAVFLILAATSASQWSSVCSLLLAATQSKPKH